MGSAAVTEIEIGPTCTTGYGSVAAAKKGHVIAVKMDVATSPTDNPGASSCPTGYDFAATGPVGYTTNGVHAEGLCIADRELFTGPTQANSKNRGWILLDSPAADGSLTFRPTSSAAGQEGRSTCRRSLCRVPLVDRPGCGRETAHSRPAVAPPGRGRFPGGPGKTWSPGDFVSLVDDLEQRVFGTLPDETWVYPGMATTPRWARSARPRRTGAHGAGDADRADGRRAVSPCVTGAAVDGPSR